MIHNNRRSIRGIVDPNQRRYHIFATIQAVASAMVISGLILLYKLRPDMLRSSSAAFACLMLAILVVAYYLSFHQLLKHRLARISTVIVSVLSAADIWLVISQTGGLDSPYISIWLFYLVGLGTIGRVAPLLVGTATSGLYVYSLIATHPQNSQLFTRVVELTFTISATILAEWLATHSFRPPGGKQAVDLSGRLSEEQLKTQALMAAMGEGVIVVNPRRQVQLFNRAAQLLTGWDENSTQNLDYRTVLKLKTNREQEVNDNIDPFMRAWEQKSAVVSNDFVMTTQAGRTVAITMTTSPIYDAAGKISGGVALFRDISAEKEMERQRDEFISTASHEMRTPIAAIEGYLSLAMNQTTATIDDRAKGYLVKAHDSIGHLGELFKNLLVITKLEDNKLADKIETVNLSQLVQKAVEDMKSAAQNKGLTLQLTSGDQQIAELNPILPVYNVTANPERLREVTMNLIENAIKYTPQGRVTVSITGNEEFVTVSVADSGMGIASEDLPHLFQKFYRVDNSATRTIGGTGLGLYICRTIIELYQGRIWAESRVGQGSTFSFRLPRLKNEGLAEAGVSAPNSKAGTIMTTRPLTQAPVVPIDGVGVAPAQPVASATPAVQPSSNLLSLKPKP